MKCPTCGQKSIFGLHCNSCNSLWNQNLDKIKQVYYQVYNNKSSHEVFYDLINEFSFYFCKSNFLTKIINDIKLTFNMQIKFEKDALDQFLINLINELFEKSTDVDLFNAFKLLSFNRPYYSPNIHINESNFPNISAKLKEVIAKFVDQFLEDKISYEDVYNKIIQQNTYIDMDFKNSLKEIIIDKIKNMASDYFFNTEELVLIDKMFILYPEIKSYLKYEKWYSITSNMTKYLNNPDEIDFKEYYKLENSFMIDNHERVLYCDKNISFYKMKYRTKIKSNGLGLSIKICNGVYLRPSSFTSTPVNEEYLDCIASGNLIITNENLIIDGDNYSNKIPFQKILNVQVYSDGIDILFSNREKPIFCQTKYSHVLYSMLIMLKNK